MVEKLIVEPTPADMIDILLCGAIYEEGNDTELNQPLKLQEDRTLRIHSVTIGQNAAGAEVPILIDTNGVMWTHAFENYQIVDPVAMTNAEIDLFAPGGTGDQLYAVELNVININNAAAYEIITSLGHAVGGGALAQSEMFIRDDSIPIRGATGWMGPYIIRGDDVIRGQAALNNALTVHFRVRRSDIGA